MNITTKDIIDWNYLLTLKSKEPHNQIKDGIETALHRTEYYKDPIDKAAALFHSLINNHHFLQANKRTALVALLVLLSDYDFNENFLEHLVMDTTNHHLEVDEISRMLRIEMKLTEVITNHDVYFVLVKYHKLIDKLVNL